MSRTPPRPPSFCIKGREAICEAVGENWKHFTRLVEEEGLPAFRARPSGQWKALPADLHAWLKAQRDRCLGGRE
ncbi:MAG: DNA-binding protein [Thermodesulfobacteriota bacterium]